MSKRFNINPRISLHGNESQQGRAFDPVAIVPNVPTASEFERVLMEQRNFDLSVHDEAMNNSYTLAAFGSIYTKVSAKLQSIIRAVDDMRSFYLTEVILNQITEDALSPRIGSDEIIQFTHHDPEIQKELTALKKAIGLDQLLLNITPDLCAYGEYTLQTEIGGSEEYDDELNVDKTKTRKAKSKPLGITDVRDIVDQGTVISLTQDGYTTGYLVLDEITGRVEIKELADFVKFSIGGQRIRIDVKQFISPMMVKSNPTLRKIFDSIPRFIRVGKSMLYPVLSKLKELELLEKLVPATKLNKLSQGNLVGLPLPENYDLKTAMEAARRVEGMINKKVQVDPTTQEITVEAILSSAGRTRVIPLFGEKGRLETMEYKSQEPDDLMGSTKDIRELILDSVGVPTELVYKSDGESKADILKRYAKYLRKLKKVQKALAEGAKQIAYIHLANKDIEFSEEDVGVTFLNSLVEIDNLDKLEYADVTLNLLSNVRDFFNEMSQPDSPYKDQIQINKVSEYIETNLQTIGLSDALKTVAEGGPPAKFPSDEEPAVEEPNVDEVPVDEPTPDNVDDGSGDTE